MKKKVLLTSITVIALCLCIIAGSTFALFTSKSEVNIAVTAGKVEVVAGVENFKLYSVEANPDGTIEDENGGKYEYVERTDGKFINGGTATLDGSMVTLDKITPGDKISFSVDGMNYSDVAIKCRYTVQCAGDEELMKGLLVYVNGVAYPALKSYTSAWEIRAAGESITNDNDKVEIVVELPVDAGNEYQGKTTTVQVLIEAVQGNAAVTGSKAIAQFLDGEIDLTEFTITDSVYNYGEVELMGGTIDVDGRGFENYGNATLNGVTLNAGSASDYGLVGRGEESVTVLDDVNYVSGGGAIGAIDGATVTVNGGTYYVDSTSTSGRYLIYTEGEGTTVYVNGGDYSWDKNDNQKRAYIYAGEGTTVYVNGGTFGKASTRSGYTAGILGAGKVVIKGGTFGFDPTAWVADGYKAEKNGTTWTVSPLANDTASLNEAIANGETTIALGAGNYTLPTTTGDMTILGTKDTVITVNKPKAENITFKGVTVVGSGYATGIQHSTKVVYEDCVLKGTQCLYADEVIIKNCVIDLTEKTDYLWTYGAKNVTIEGCTFNTNGKAILIYNEGANLVTNVTVKNCTFNATASALASGATAAAIEIDSSLATNGHYTLTTEGNTVDSDFSGEWRIKKSGTDNTTVNGNVYNAITIDGEKQ